MAIDIEHGFWLLLCLLLLLGLLLVPQGPGPLGQRIGETFIDLSMSETGEKLLDIGIAVRATAPRHESQQRSGVGAQIPGTGQSSHRQKQQRQQQSFYHCRVEWETAAGCCGCYALNRSVKGCQQSCLMGSRQQEQASYSLLPHWLRHDAFFLARPFHGAVTPASARTRLICPRLTSKPKRAWSSALTWLE